MALAFLGFSRELGKTWSAVMGTYEEQNISSVIAAFDGGVLVPYCFPEIDIVVSSGCVLHWFVTGHCAVRSYRQGGTIFQGFACAISGVDRGRNK